MEDAQSPPDAENQKDDHPRRAGLRLRDAEAVASTRRDMFGDGSLLDALAGPSPPPEEERGDPGVSSPAEPAEASPAELAQAQGEPEPATGPEPSAAAPEPQQAEPPEIAQTLDAIIDSFPAEAPQNGLREPLAESSLPAGPPFTSLDDGTEDGLASHQPPPAAAQRYQVSAIFEGLGGEEPPQGGPDGPQGEPGAEPPQPEPPGLAPPAEAHGLGMPADEPGATDQEDQGDGGALAGAPIPAAEPPGYDTADTPPAAGAVGLGVPLFSQPAGIAPMPEPSHWPPFPTHPAATSEEAQSDAEHPAPPDWSAAPLPEPPQWPPYPEPPGAGAALDAQPAPREPQPFTERQAAGGAAPSPFPAPPAWPPFPEPPGAEAEASPPEPSGLPPYIELPANPESVQEYSEPSAFSPRPVAPDARSFPPPPGAFPQSPAAATEAPPFSEPHGLPRFQTAAPSFADPPAASALPESGEVPGAHEGETARPALDATARASAAATAKIAEEASATAQALDNLQRLLTKTVPPTPPAPQPARPQRPREAHLNLQGEPPPFVYSELAAIPPLPVPPEPATGRSIYLLGFITGLVLSLLAGAALYFLINTG